MFIRAFAVALALGALWWSGSSFGVGLGLGEIRIESTLASPLKASIPLRGLAEVDLDPEQFLISVESDTQAGIKYRLERIDADTATLILYTREPVTEPLFQFRVEVEWDRRAVARSYDVFVDPAVYPRSSDDGEVVTDRALAAAPVSMQSAGASPENGGETAALPVAGTSNADLAPATVDPAIRRILQAAQAGADGETRREYGPTIDGNSIWRVARAVATDNPDLNIYQWMYATWKLNPGAFFEANMHRLKMNELLVVPLQSEVAQVSRGDAWRAYSAQLALLESDAGVDSDARQSSEQIAAVENQAQADAELEKAAAVSSAPLDTARPTEVVEAAKQQTSVEPVAEEQVNVEVLQSSAAPVDENSPAAETPLSKVIALIEEVEVEREQASIVINRDSNVETGAEAGYPVILGGLEEAESSSSTVAAGTPARPHDERLNSVDTGPPVVIGTAQDSPQASATDNGEPVSAAAAASGWRARREFIGQLPLIGAEGSLAVVGRAVQKTDQFVSTSPSWAALAFGGWITLVVVMLMKEWRSHRGGATALPPARAVTTLRAATAPTRERVPEQVPARPVTLQPSSYRPPVKLPADSVGKGGKPEPRIDYNADEILAKADSFMQARDTDEAVKLLELAIKLQPDRTGFVVRLLQIFHELKRAGDFDSLLRRFLPALVELDREQQDELRAMHKRLCPRAKPLLDADADPESADDSDSTDSANGEAELTGEQASGLDCAAGDIEDETGADLPDLTSTQVTFMKARAAADGDSAESAELGPELVDLEEILNEVDVYLAYGLYDNAEELLLQGMEAEPNRVDYLAKLLDTYYATKNLVDFVTCAEALRGMGEEANNEYWDKVEIMGYELAPYNELFAGGKNRNLHGGDFEIARPAKADIDTGWTDGPAGEELAAHAEPAGSVAVNAIEDCEDLDLELDAEMSVDTVSIEGALAGPEEQPESGSRTDELVAELLAEEGEDDPTDLTFARDETSNVNFEQDAPILLAQVDKLANQDGDEIIELDASLDDDTAERLDEEMAELAASLEPEGAGTGEDEAAMSDVDRGEGLVFATDEIDLDGDAIEAVDADPELDSGTNETMKFTISGDNEFEQSALAADTDSLEDLRGPSAVHAAAEQSGQGRILLFPDAKPGQEASAEFEAEVKMTLQAIRDQLQYMTERLYRQERESCDIRQALAELQQRDEASAVAAKKKSS